MGQTHGQGVFCPTCPMHLGRRNFDAVYEVEDGKTIGTGKFSQVYACWRRDDPSLKYALKVIQMKAEDMQTVARIYSEIEIMRELGREFNHPNIIKLVDVDEGENALRLVLEYCEGGELYARIHELGRYSEQEVKELMRHLLQAVSFIHSKGIMHRDLKPENILLSTKDNNVDIKVSDFGLAKQSKDFPRRLPRSHSICGSDFYLAPEVIKQDQYGREIDIWSVGVICFVLLSGTLPFYDQDLHKLYRAILEVDLSFDNEQQWGHISPGAKDLVLRLLNERVNERLSAEQALNHPWLRVPQSPAASQAGSRCSDASNASFVKAAPQNLSTVQTTAESWAGSPIVNPQGGYGYPHQQIHTQPMFGHAQPGVFGTHAAAAPQTPFGF